jgi:hypothetical protein
MTDTVTISPSHSSESLDQLFLGFAANAWTEDKGARSRVPFFVPREQAYYWSIAWQTGESEALREIANGDARRFASGAAAAKWLLSDDA